MVAPPEIHGIRKPMKPGGFSCVPALALVGMREDADFLSLASLSEAKLEARGLRLPLVLKPVRGRGSNLDAGPVYSPRGSTHNSLP